MFKKPFVSKPGFCPKCGSILPAMKDTGNIICYSCKQEYTALEVYSAMEKEYTIHFNSITGKKYEKKKSAGSEGPIVERQCPMCGNDKMSYATLQLRSADEGQTVFYTCTKCHFKESENS
ncbi:DNA-directed RNA polymerase I subunit RPA12 [Ischnura elegans]|uniref:DNA-directed RNA polymerase I subunit RPA12 n=1 Tax=Ischnura elegans TaxID=197161 RepID=UPI001ED882CA|nr:DNA-directed RNA polymerase I subunit RPA12 [Ischnura elegans]